jgi:hypothetical protein
MAKDPKAAMAEYGGNEEFSNLMKEFSMMMGSHFTNVADKKIEEDPVMQIINNDPVVKEILADPEVNAVIHKLQASGGLDLLTLMQANPALGIKMKTLIEKGVLNVNSQMP